MSGTEIGALAAYLHDNIMGRTLYTDELIYSLEGGALAGVYSDQMTFSNLTHSSTGLRFDLFVVSRERIYAVQNGQRADIRKDFSGPSLFRYELARRESTGQITGFMRFVSAALSAVPAEAVASAVYDWRFANGEISWREKEMVYREQPGADGARRPVAFEAECRLFAEEGKARYEYRGACLDVDPVTWTRTPSRDVFPTFLSREP